MKFTLPAGLFGFEARAAAREAKDAPRFGELGGEGEPEDAELNIMLTPSPIACMIGNGSIPNDK